MWLGRRRAADGLCRKAKVPAPEWGWRLLCVRPPVQRCERRIAVANTSAAQRLLRNTDASGACSVNRAAAPPGRPEARDSRNLKSKADKYPRIYYLHAYEPSFGP